MTKANADAGVAPEAGSGAYANGGGREGSAAMQATPASASAISGHTHLVALLGRPTAHSMSPALHNLSFQLLGIDAVYLCFDVEPADLGAVLKAFRALASWDGLNVTMPHKQAVIAHLDELDEAAALMDAVNVVRKREDGAIVGHNTDGVGFMANLRRHGVRPEGARMVLLGPGGAGRAILVQAALDGVAQLDVFARAGGPSFNQARQLIERVSASTACRLQLHDIADGEDLRACVQAADIVANATPIGMGEGCDDTPVPAGFLQPGQAVADAIYHPRETRLVRDARDCGCVAVPGLGMLLEQAAAGEEIWYGVRMPVGEIERRLF